MLAGLTMIKLKSICPTCGGLGTVKDKIWGKRKCPNHRCIKGKITVLQRTGAEIDRDFKAEQESMSAQGKL